MSKNNEPYYFCWIKCGWTKTMWSPIGLIGNALIPIPEGKPVAITQQELDLIIDYERKHRLPREVRFEMVNRT